MSYLRGTYPLHVPIAAADPCNPFERAALAKLGGSICFVRDAPMMWRSDAN